MTIMNIYIRKKKFTLFSVDMRVLFFIPKWGMLQFDIRAQVAIPGT